MSIELDFFSILEMHIRSFKSETMRFSISFLIKKLFSNFQFLSSILN